MSDVKEVKKTRNPNPDYVPPGSVRKASDIIQNPDRAVTNSDVVRGASDEQLARMLSNVCVGCFVGSCKLHNHGSWFCQERILKWLKEPVGGNDA